MQIHLEKQLPDESRSFMAREFVAREPTAPFHFHPRFEITTILSGAGRRFVGDSVEDFGPGDLVMMGPNLLHCRTKAPGDVEAGEIRWIVVQFRADCFGELFFQTPELITVQRLLDQSGSGLHFAGEPVAEAQALMARLCDASGARRLTLLVELLGRLAAAPRRRLTSAGYSPQIDAPDVSRIERVINYVESHHEQESLTLVDAARVACLSPCAFSRFFTRTVGRSFIRYVNEIRVSHACHLLTGTDLPVIEICFATGFGTTSNFYDCFRALKGLTPGEYRRLPRAAAAQPIAKISGAREPQSDRAMPGLVYVKV